MGHVISGKRAASYLNSISEKQFQFTALKNPKCKLPYIADGCTSVYAQYTIQVENREDFQGFLKKNGVPTAVHYPLPLNRQPLFSYLNQKAIHVPVAEHVAKHVVSLPMGAWMDEVVVEHIANTIQHYSGQ